LRAAAGIERDHFVEGRTENQAVFDQQRGGLELRTGHHGRRTARQIAGVKFEGAHETTDIGRRDLGKVRKARSTLIAAPVLPGQAGLRRKAGGRQQQHRYERNEFPRCTG
jgi:hypothetical protein